MRHQTKVIFGGLMGNVVEAYDMSICYFLSRELSQVLLGDTKGNSTVILGLIFLAYLAKPVGAFILGLLSDLYGRKNVLAVSILIMGFSTAFIGLIPSYQHIGLAAAGLLLLLRIIQSMALGAEFLNSASYLVESGNEKQRGFRGCWSSVGVKAGYLIACVFVELLHYYQSLHPAQDWFWRVPFMLALITTAIGFFIRYSMPESLAYIVYYSERSKPTTRIIYRQALSFIKESPFMFNYAFFASFLSVATGFFFYLYIPMHARQYSLLPHSFIMTSTMLSLLVATVLIPIFGWISDKQDRLKMLSSATIGLLILSYPYMQAVNYGTASYFLIMQLVISIPCACYYSVSSVLLTELFPIQIRCTALSIVYSLAASLAAGAPPLLADYLTRKTQSPNSPAFIMMFLSLIVLVNVFILNKNYRVSKNSYKQAQLKDEDKCFIIYYQKDSAAL